MTDNWVTVPNGNFFIIGPNSVITEEMIPLLRRTPNIHKLTYWVREMTSYPVSKINPAPYNQAVDLRLGAPKSEYERIEKMYRFFFLEGGA